MSATTTTATPLLHLYQLGIDQLLPSNNYSYNPGGRFYGAKYIDRRSAIQSGGPLLKQCIY